MPGRSPVPIRVHKANGTYRKERHGNRGELSTAGEGVGEMPEWFSGEAKAEWERLTQHPSYARNLSMVHRGIMIEYCTEHAAMIEGCKRSAGVGDGKIYSEARGKHLAALRTQLCLTPGTEGKLPARPQESADDKWKALG